MGSMLNPRQFATSDFTKPDSLLAPRDQYPMKRRMGRLGIRQTGLAPDRENAAKAVNASRPAEFYLGYVPSAN